MTFSAPLVTPATRYVGDVVYLYAFDIADELNRTAIPSLLGQPMVEFQPDASKRSPRQLFFYKPRTVRLPAIQRVGPHGPVKIERSIKILPVGAISITVRVPFSVENLLDLVGYHDLKFADGAFLYDEVRQLAEDARTELNPYCVRPVQKLGDEEAYTVFCVDTSRSSLGVVPAPGGSPAWSAEDWLFVARREVAAVLTEEHDLAQLSDQEADESTGKYFSYYERDLVVIDWDAALVLDEPKYFDEVLHIMELANVQLAELEAYDRLLDATIDRAYRDISTRKLAVRRRDRAIDRELREIRIDLARLQDELSNITKFFGDWHLARIYQGLNARFHLADWHRTIDEKLKTLDDMYQLLRHDQNNRLMLILEAAIVLLFIIDLVTIFAGVGK